MNGWKNYNTWNVALWINNDESLYHIARSCPSYEGFADTLKSMGESSTPDGVLYGCCTHGWNDLDRDALNQLIKDIN